MGQPPEHFGLARTGWWLVGIREAVDWLYARSLSTVYQTLRRAHIRYRRGRRYVHSPDPLYAAKLASIAYVRERARRDPQRVVVLYEDEFTYHRRSSVAAAYALVGRDAPRAAQGWGADTTRRIAACLDVRTGQVQAAQRAHWPARALLAHLEQVAAAYPDAARIYVVLDNWPVHFQRDLLADLAARTRIRLLRLPTYAPWTNPVEKLWRKLYAEVLHLHRFCDAWSDLTATVQAWLDQWIEPAPELLRYVGLLCPN